MTSVVKSATSETGCSTCSVRCNAAGPALISARRHSCATITGTTIYNTTEISRVSQGTLIEATPSSRPTSGANANTMMTSLRATWLKV